MSALFRGAYDAIASLAMMASLVTPDGGGKLRRSLAARRGIRSRFQTWAALNRDRRRPLLWMHAPSVGEGLQAAAVLARVRESSPDVQLVYTFYSPSAADFAASIGADYVDYLPFDTPGDAEAAITAVAPTAFVYSKLDLWPNFTRVASLRGIRLGMISATVSEGSGRRGWLTRKFMREAWSRLDAVGAVSSDDAARIIELGARPEVVFVTGDTRYDQVWDRAHTPAPRRDEVTLLDTDAPTVVAGSTWPADEEHLLPAFLQVRERLPSVRIIIAPHEPTEKHLRSLERWGRSEKLNIVRLSSGAVRSAQIVLVDSVGMLGDIYALADVAFVGGGFHTAGLHSVLEPAAFGIPVLFGPMFRNSRDAQALIRARGGSSVRSAAELSESISALLTDSALLADARSNATSVVQQGCGAAARSHELVDALLAGGR